MSENQKDTFTFTAGGDVMMSRSILPYLGVSERFDGLIRLMREADTTVVNLETVIHDYETPAAGVGGTAMRTSPTVIDGFPDMGITMLVTANNHVWDYGIDGLRSTIWALDARNIPHAGAGMNLFEARSPDFDETAAGRVALVATTNKITRGSPASEQSPALPGKPGVNPLKVEMIQTLSETDLEDLRRISDNLGWEDIKQAWLDRGFYSSHDWNQEEYFHFGDMKFSVTDDPEAAGISYEVDEGELAEVCSFVSEADRSSDWVVASIHSHDGPDGPHKRLTTEERPSEPTNNERTPEFLRTSAKRCLDSGADVVIGTGPHVVRGIELHDGKPIFYSLGNFIMQRPSVTRFPPHMYHRYGLTDYTKPSTIFDHRFRDEAGNYRGDLANPYMWETFLPECTFRSSGELVECVIHPVSLQRDAGDSQRGIPVLAEGEEAEIILDRVAGLSETFGTEIDVRDDVGVVQLD